MDLAAQDAFALQRQERITIAMEAEARRLADGEDAVVRVPVDDERVDVVVAFISIAQRRMARVLE